MFNMQSLALFPALTNDTFLLQFSQNALNQEFMTDKLKAGALDVDGANQRVPLLNSKTGTQQTNQHGELQWKMEQVPVAGKEFRIRLIQKYSIFSD